MTKFELISKYAGEEDILLPRRKTAESAGYDFFVAEDIVIPAYEDLMVEFSNKHLSKTDGYIEPVTLDEMAALTKEYGVKPTLVPTGAKAKLESYEYLEMAVRSSCPLKYWLVMPNSVGIVDADYYNNPDNEGHIHLQLINLSPVPIQLHKGDCVGQGIIHIYQTAENDNASGKRVGGFGSTDEEKKIIEAANKVAQGFKESLLRG